MIPWQRASIQAAASYLRERISQGDHDRRTKVIYEGLLEVLDPTRRATRVQHELAAAAKAAVTVQEARDRRALADRRRHKDRRQANLGSPTGVDRRRTADRRARDRRSGA